MYRRSFNATLAGLVAGVSAPSLLRISENEGDRRAIVLKAEFTAHFPAVLKIVPDLAHALLRAASPLLATLGAEEGVEMSLDAARTSACATLASDCVLELRVYRTTSNELEHSLRRLFPRAGIHPLVSRELTYLIPFVSLAAREQAWRSLNADPEWNQVRHQVDSYRFGLYRVAA